MKFRSALAALGLLFAAVSPAIAAPCDVIVDGQCRLDVDIIRFVGIPDAALSSSNTSHMYFDIDTGTVLCSEDGGAYSDCFGGGADIPYDTVANLPGSPSAGDLAGVTDGNADDDCTTGGGSTFNLCQYTGSAWVVVGDGTSASGADDVSVDGSAVTDPDFVSTGDIDFVNTSNTVTANINAGVIIETDLDGDVAPEDEDFLQYDSTGTNFTWRSPSEVLSDIGAITASSSDTLTNKTIDGDDNTLQDILYSQIKSTSRSGADTTLVTGTAGTSGNCAEWNADGDLVDAGAACGSGSGGAFDDSSDPIVQNTTTKDVHFGDGAGTLTGKVEIGGDADQPQLVVEGHSTQTDDIFIIQKDDDTEVMSVSNTGVIKSAALTASEILGTDASKNIVSLAVATYPSLTELTYVKGVTSAIQTQMNLKAPLISPSFTTPTLGVASSTSVIGTITLAGNPGLGANTCSPAANGIICEGTSADNFEGLLTWPVTTSDKTITFQNATGTVYQSGGTDVPVADGGTGRSTSTTAYGLIAAGTTATGAHQTLAAGATTQILVGGGASALPVWTTATGSGAPVRATSPTLVTPALGTPSSVTLTNATGYPSATSSASGISELAIASEVTTGTDTGRTITPDGLAGSDFGKRMLSVLIFGSGTAVTTGNGTSGVPITSELNGYDIVDVQCNVYTKGVTGTTTVVLRKQRGGTDSDVTSTGVTLGDEYYVADEVIDTGEDDLATGDMLFFDVDGIHSGTAPNGLSCVAVAQLP